MNKLRLMRIEAGLSQFELSLASGVPRFVIQLAEAGTRLPNYEQRQLLAETLGVETYILFGVSLSPDKGGDHGSGT